MHGVTSADQKPCKERCISVHERCGAGPQHSRPAGGRPTPSIKPPDHVHNRPSRPASRRDQDLHTRPVQKPSPRSSRSVRKPGHMASRVNPKPNPATTRGRPVGRASVVPDRPSRKILFLKSNSPLKDLFKSGKLVSIHVRETDDGTWQHYDERNKWKPFTQCLDGEALVMPTLKRIR